MSCVGAETILHFSSLSSTGQTLDMYRVTLLCGALAVFCQAYPHDSYSYLPQRGRTEEWVSQTQVGEKQELEGWQKQKLAEIDEL